MQTFNRFFLFVVALGLFAVAFGCSDPSSESPPEETTGAIIVGVTTDLLVGVDIKRLLA